MVSTTPTYPKEGDLMKQCTSYATILQKVMTKEEVEAILEALGVIDTARKFTFYDLLLFLVEAAGHQWEGYRDGEQRMASVGLRTVDHSTLSKKAKSVPFLVFKQLLRRMIKKCSRPVRRKLGIPKALLVVDSTKVTVGKGRLPWAPLSGSKAGIKLHVALLPERREIYQVTESTGNSPDLHHCGSVLDSAYILVADRAYVKLSTFDSYMKQGQKFVIRLQDNTHFHEPVQRERKQAFGGTITSDFTCLLGTQAKRTQHAFRVVQLSAPNGELVILATNLHWYSPEAIAQIYKQRWEIEVFFRWIKQHFNIKMLYGTTENAVYGQLYSALLLYVLLAFLFHQGQTFVHVTARLSFTEFHRLAGIGKLPVEWVVYLVNFIVLPNP
jgi:hypothetical protein